MFSAAVRQNINFEDSPQFWSVPLFQILLSLDCWVSKCLQTGWQSFSDHSDHKVVLVHHPLCKQLATADILRNYSSTS